MCVSQAIYQPRQQTDTCRHKMTNNSAVSSTEINSPSCCRLGTAASAMTCQLSPEYVCTTQCTAAHTLASAQNLHIPRSTLQSTTVDRRMSRVSTRASVHLHTLAHRLTAFRPIVCVRRSQPHWGWLEFPHTLYALLCTTGVCIVHPLASSREKKRRLHRLKLHSIK